MAQSMAGAMAVLESAAKALQDSQGQMMAVADGPVNEAKELVRAVWSAGFEIDGLNSIIGRIEELGNELHEARARAEGIVSALKETIG